MNCIYLTIVAFGLLANFVLQTQEIAVMSVDIGNEYTKIAVVKPGVPMEIVLNKESQRKTASVVFISSEERLYAESANSKGVRKPALLYAHLLDVIGKNMSHPSVIKYKEAFPFYDLVEDKETLTVGFRTDEGDNTRVLRPEELIGMILEYARGLVEDFSEQPVKSGVITVPVHFGQLERRAILRAADLAGIEVLQLMNDNAATALQFGLVKLASINETPQYYVIFDLGSTHTTASVVSYDKAKAKDDGEMVEHVVIRGVAYSRDLSTTAIHNAVRNLLIKQYQDQRKGKSAPDVTKDHKAMGKLLKEAARVVHILSANNIVPSHVEGLIGEVDFAGQINRADLEAVCDPIFKLIPDLIKDALKRANIGSEAIGEIVLMGAGTRIPKVHEMLKKSLDGREVTELGRGLNTDEAAALGAVYQAAHLSKGFKVKRIVLRDAVTYPVSVEFDRISDNSHSSTPARQDPGIVRRMLFDLASPFPQKKLITFGKHSTDFSFNVTFTGGSDPIWQVKVTDVEKAFQKHADKVSKGIKAHFAMDDSGLLHLRMVEAVFEAEENETIASKDGGSIGGIFSSFGDKIKGLFNGEDNSTANATAEAPAGEEGTTPAPQTETSTDTAQTNETASSDEKFVVKTKTVIYKENLTFEITYLNFKPFPDEEMEKGREMLREFRQKDEIKRQLAKAKNDLESSVIDVKDKLEQEEYKKFVTQEDWDAIFAKAKEIGDWLDEEAGPRTPLSELNEKQQQLRQIVLPWYERMRQANERPKNIGAILNTLNHSQILLNTFRSLSANISAEANETLFSDVELNTFERQINETYSWLTMMTEAQETTKPHEDVKLKIEDIREKGTILEREARYLTNKAKAYRPKPKPKVKAKRTTPANGTNETVIIDENAESPVPPTSDDGAESPTIPPTSGTTTEKPVTDKQPVEDEDGQADPTHSPEL